MGKHYLFCLGILCLSLFSTAQKSLPVIKANSTAVSIRENGELMRNTWRISPELKPDVHVTGVKGKSTWVSFITDTDSIGFTVKPGDSWSFIILLNGKDSALTEIRGEKFVEPAVFNKKYKKRYDRKTTTDLPEVYELANIVFALTDEYKQNPWAIEKGSDYFKEVLAWFEPYSQDPLVRKMDTLLKRGWYSRLKMDAYAFEFDKNGRIVQSKVYDRVSWDKKNTLRPFIPQLQAFSDKSWFRDFFKAHQAFYEAQIRSYRDSINTKEMVAWLNKNFPSTRYNSFKIVWSPLVGGNQSANWFENNGFKEAHAHVNFPYAFRFTRGSKEAIDVRRGNIVFTELNHAYINPEADKYKNEIIAAFPDKYVWVEKGKAGDGYGADIGIFNEYMNWGLVGLRYVDYAPKAELDTLLRQLENYMVQQRGFTRFAEFNQFLVVLYQERKPGETLADLYPKIVVWFNEHKQR
jgi:hypothetical protein